MLIDTLAKRLVGVVTVRQGLAVQSFGYQRWLPLGRPEVLVENLDRWGADEILVLCIDRADRGPDLALLDRLGALGLSTPLIYGGGIRDAAQAAAVVQRAADRIAVDALLHDEPAALRPIAERLGAQAVVAALPLALDAGGGLSWLDHRSGRSRPLPEGLGTWWRDGLVSEALLIDWQHEGQRAGFDPRLSQAFDTLGLPYIAFGGLSEPEQLRQQLLAPQCVAVAMGNFLSWREHAVQDAKRALQGLPLRAPAWAASAVPPCVPRLVSERVNG